MKLTNWDDMDHSNDPDDPDDLDPAAAIKAVHALIEAHPELVDQTTPGALSMASVIKSLGAPETITVPRMPPKPEQRLLKDIAKGQAETSQVQAAILNTQKALLDRAVQRDEQDAKRDRRDLRINIAVLVAAVIAAIVGILALVLT